MDEADSKFGATVGNGAGNTEEQPAARMPPSERSVAAERAAPGTSVLHILKPGQGIHVRWGTAGGAGLLVVGLAMFIWEQIRVIRYVDEHLWLRTLIPVVVLVGAAYLVFWLVGRNHRVVDFLIGTEGEMKKVNWSTRREVWGATRIVIVTLFALALILAIVDAVFILFFSEIGVLQFNVLKQFFYGGSA